MMHLLAAAFETACREAAPAALCQWPRFHLPWNQAEPGTWHHPMTTAKPEAVNWTDFLFSLHNVW